MDGAADEEPHREEGGDVGGEGRREGEDDVHHGEEQHDGFAAETVREKPTEDIKK